MTGRKTPKRRLIAAGFGLTSLVVIGFTLNKCWSGEPVGTSELTSIAAALAAMFGALTWGSKEEGEGIMQEEEMGRHIRQRQSGLFYYACGRPYRLYGREAGFRPG
ncbi:hypothetical protein [Paenibacillus sp. 1P03SA]|uniref:hypothetical protein n=1 Tax=Paenibacillus sp. 1P03SA TaxID=3132294 RepID=UPI0039A2A4AB